MITHRYDSDKGIELIIIKCDKCGNILEAEEKPYILETSDHIKAYIEAKYIPRRFHLCTKCYNEFCSSRKFSMEIVEDK